MSVVPQVGLRPMAVQNARCAARVNSAMLLAVVAKLVPPVVFERRLIYQQNVNFAWPERTKTKHNKPLVCHAYRVLTLGKLGKIRRATFV